MLFCPTLADTKKVETPWEYGLQLLIVESLCDAKPYAKRVAYANSYTHVSLTIGYALQQLLWLMKQFCTGTSKNQRRVSQFLH